MKRACVVGHPVHHSLSPKLHGYWLKKYGIDGDYGREDIPPDALPDFLSGLKENGFIGCNLTIPHKEAALPLMDHLDDTAKQIGAVNTVLVRDGKLYGYNSDAYGFITHLEKTVPDVSLENVLVIGAGGAARAVIYALKQKQNISTITVMNRTRVRAEKLAADFDGVSVTDWNRAPQASLVINTTSLGMAGQPVLDISLEGLSKDAVVYDLVYHPLKTDLLLAAEKEGLRTVDGLGMLLHQGRLGFRLWFGVDPVVDRVLRQSIEREL